MCFPDTSLFPASPPRAEMKPWPLLTSIARAQSGSGGRRHRVPCCEGPAGTPVVALSPEGCERQYFTYCICVWFIPSTDMCKFFRNCCSSFPVSFL